MGTRKKTALNRKTLLAMATEVRARLDGVIAVLADDAAWSAVSADERSIIEKAMGDVHAAACPPVPAWVDFVELVEWAVAHGKANLEKLARYVVDEFADDHPDLPPLDPKRVSDAIVAWRRKAGQPLRGGPGKWQAVEHALLPVLPTRTPETENMQTMWSKRRGLARNRTHPGFG